jgi:ribosomal protein S18 acetylase RimI-like enzyme
MAASDAAAAVAGAPPILRLNADDADAVWPLSVEAGWNQVPADWRLMIAAGSAFGLQDAAGRWIASALALPLGPQVSWISMVLVTQAERRRGHGTRLLRHCIASIEATGSVMGLDATEFGRPVYLPLGFRDVYAISRWSVPHVPGMPVAPPSGIAIRPAGPQDLERIADHDSRCSGFERRAIVAELLARAPHVAFVAERGDGGLAGFGLGRDGHRATHVGPVMAEDPGIGLALASRALAGVRGPAILDVPDRQEHIRRWLQSHGATAPRSFMRMLRGSAPAVEDGSRIMAIAGPELA